MMRGSLAGGGPEQGPLKSGDPVKGSLAEDYGQLVLSATWNSLQVN